MRGARVVALSVALVAACGEAPRDPVSGPLFSIDGVEVTRVAEGIRLENGTSVPLAYAVWAKGFLGRFAPCIDTSPECLRLGPGAAVLVPVDDIVGMWPGEREAIVRWWRVVFDGSGGYRATGLREVVLAL